MPCSLYVFRPGSGRFAKGEQVGFVAHEKIGERGKKASIIDGLAQHVGLHPRQCQKTGKHIRFTGKPAKYGDRRFMRILHWLPVIFFITQHLFTAVTYFSTKSH